MPKSYSAARIQNPTSLQQVVTIHPGQDLLIYLDDELYGELTVEVSSGYLTLTTEKSEEVNGRLLHCYSISPVEEVKDWAKYSSTLLGEVWIDGQKAMGKVGILLESTCIAKRHIRTIVNPDCMDLRIYPYNVVEVIAYDLGFGYHDEWHCEWRPLIEGLGLEQIGYDHLCLHSWDSYYNGIEPAEYLYARLPRGDAGNGLLTRQHHFWFRFDAKIFEVCAKNNALVCAGNIVINGLSNRFQLQHAQKTAYHVALYVDCRRKWYEQIQQTLSLKLHNESKPGLLSVATQTIGPRLPVKDVLPTIRDIGIRLIDSGEITDCKTLPTLNNSYRPQSMWPYDDDYEVPRHGLHHHPKWWRNWN